MEDIILGLSGIILLLLISALLSALFWLWMLIDCLRRDFENEGDKLVWTLVILFTNGLGATVYYFAVKRKS